MLTKRERISYLVGMFGQNGAVPNEHFIRVLHRLYGVRYTRENLFPRIVKAMGSCQLKFPPQPTSRLAVIVLSQAGVDQADIDNLVSEDLWSANSCEPDISLLTMTARMEGADTVAARNCMYDSYPRGWWNDVQHAGYLHDQLLAGVAFDSIESPVRDIPVQPSLVEETEPRTASYEFSPDEGLEHLLVCYLPSGSDPIFPPDVPRGLVEVESTSL